MFCLIFLAIGLFIVSFLPSLFTAYNLVVVLITLCVVGLFFFRYRSCFKPVLIFIVLLILGLCWGLINAHRVLENQLPVSLDKSDFVVRGVVRSLVNKQSNRLSFVMDVYSINHDSDVNNILHNVSSLKKLRLSWYGKVGSMPNLNSGDQWQLLVRLKRPRGLGNFAGFDYHVWLVENNFSATGYVLASDLNRPIGMNYCGWFCSLKIILSRLRENLQLSIYAADLSDRNKAIISALTIGDKSILGKWWGDLSRLGIVHLLVISGLHIGLVAGLGFLFGQTICRVLMLMTVNFNIRNNFSHYFPPLCGLFFALFYSLLAGFSLPTQRAMVAVILVMLCKILYLRLSAFTAFVWALFLIAITQPLAVIGASFWLSFSAVAVLLLYFVPRVTLKKKKSQLFFSQWILFVGMAAPLLLFVGKISWLGIVVNLIAVPLVSFITVPLCLIGAMVFFYAVSVAQLLWQWAGSSIDGLWFLVELLPVNWGFYHFSFPTSALFFGCLMLLAFAALLPKGLLSRWILILPFMLHLLAHKPRLPLRITVLDVGQGLSVVVESQTKLMVYDVGAAYGDGFDMGSAVVAPFVINRGFKQIDRVVVSHGDNDHFGGFKGLSQNLPVKKAFLTPGFFSQAFNDDSFAGKKGYCDGSKRWKWLFKNSAAKTEWIFFDILFPVWDSLGGVMEDSNNNSCVLLIRWRDISILLPGDIEKQAERLLLERYQLPPVDLLVAPHHGSKTSSGKNFVEQLMPTHVVFSAGYRHHFGHPHKDVVARYQQRGSQLWSTAEDGAITFEWNDSGELNILTAKESRAKFWWR
jgi:competence protein ComEC